MMTSIDAQHIVIVDASPDDRAEARRLLLKGSDRRYVFTEAETGAAGIRAVREWATAQHRCVMLDYKLPDMSAPAFLAAISGGDGAPGWPVVVFTEDDSAEAGRSALRAGAHDYVGKDWMTPQVLVRAVENAAERWAMARELWQQKAAAHASEQHYRALAKASSEIAYRMSADWSSTHPLDGRGLIPSSDTPLEDWAWLDRNVPRDEHPRVRQAISEAIAQKTLFTLEHRVLRPDGSMGWTLSRAVPILDENGDVVEWFGAASDISQRKAAEHALARSEAFARSVVESSADCVKGLTLDGRLLWMNENGQRQMEVSDFAALRGCEWGRFWDAGAIRAEAEAALATARAGGIGRFYGFSPTVAGTPRWWDVAVTAIPGPDGRAEQLLSVSRDVTQQRASAEASRLSTQRMELALKCSAVVLFQQDLDLRYTWICNPTLGFKDSEVVGKRDIDLMERAADAEVTQALKQDVIRTGVGRRHEVLVHHQDDVHHYHLLVEALWDATGIITGVTCAAIDITDLKQAKQALSEQDLRKDEFLATLSHELRNPLAPIRSGVAVLRMSHHPERAEKTLGMIDRQLGHMVRLIDDLLDVSRITSGKVVLRPERIELQTAIHTAVEAVRPLLDAAAQVLRLDLPSEPIWLQADATRICQVMINLLANAAKYSPHGSLIGLAVHRASSDVVVTVADQGDGIPPNMLTHIFEMFTQVNRTPDRAQGGLGIGLALVKRLVEMHGGTVSVDSAGLGAGSTFTVRLPTLNDAGGLDSKEAPPQKAIPDTRLRVLVVDDNADAAESLAELLSLYGHETRVADSGLSALALVREFRPALVLLDIGMPGMNGYETARRIRADDPSGSVTLVALTGWGAESDRIKAKEAGFDHHFTKPVELDLVESVLQQVALRQSSAGSS